MRILVTGGAGFIGSHTADLLHERGHQIRVLDILQPRVHPRGKPDYLNPAFEFIKGDVADKATLARAMDGMDAVYHLAAYQDYMTDFSHFIHTNAESTALLFELIVERELPVRKVVLASSQSVAGEGKYRCSEHGLVYPPSRSLEQLSQGQWEITCPDCGQELVPELIDEGVARPHTAYGISKYALEMLALNLGRKYGVPTVCMRYTYVQGPRNSYYNAYSGIARIFALRVLNGEPPVCFEDGRQQRDFINVTDVARANVLVLDDPRADHRVFNVGGGVKYTVAGFAEAFVKVAGCALEPEIPGVFRVGDTRHTISDISALRELGWEPCVPIETSIRQYLDWIRTQPDVRAEYFRQAEEEMRRTLVLRSVESR